MHERVHTPVIRQREATECFAISLCVILGYYGKYVPLSEIRTHCDVSRDGANALNMLKAARHYGLIAKGYKKQSVAALKTVKPPFVAYYNFNHGIVVEGVGDEIVYVNDSVTGPEARPYEQFDDGFTGVIFTFAPGSAFQPGGRPARFEALRACWHYFDAAEQRALLLPSLAALGVGLTVIAFIAQLETVLIAEDPFPRGVLLTLLLLGAGLLLLQTFLLARLSERVARRTADELHRHVLRLPISYFSNHDPETIVGWLATGDTVARRLPRKMTQFILLLALVAGGSLALGAEIWYLALPGLACATAIGVLCGRAWTVREPLNRDLVVASAFDRLVRSRFFRRLDRLKAHAGERTYTFGMLAWQKRQHNRLHERNRKLHRWRAYLEGFILLNVLLTGLVAAGLFAGGLLSPGALGTILLLGALVSAALVWMVSLVLGFQFEYEGIVERALILEALPDPMFTSAASNEADAAAAATLTVNNLTFGFNRTEPPLVSGIDLRLAPGRFVAVMGPSGCGKSTLARLIAGLYVPWSGDVLLDGIPVSEWGAAGLVRLIGVVEQEAHFFEGTIRENLTLWDPHLTEEALRRATQDACLYDEVQALPDGFDTRLADDGRNLSGSQRQRLDLVRALARSPRLLVLDEATRAVSLVVERKILAHLRRRGCGCLFITHRIETARLCDEVIVLDRGRIVERGPAAHLEQQGGFFAALCAER